MLLLSLVVASCLTDNQDVQEDKEDQTGNVTLHTITFDTNRGSDLDPVKVQDGKVYAWSATGSNVPTRDNYAFVEWQLDGQKYEQTPIYGDIVLKAVWEGTLEGWKVSEASAGGLVLD